eukprot:2870305-Rhodomonas_salina.1
MQGSFDRRLFPKQGEEDLIGNWRELVRKPSVPALSARNVAVVCLETLPTKNIFVPSRLQVPREVLLMMMMGFVLIDRVDRLGVGLP